MPVSSRHYILNGSYVIRRRDGSSSSERIGSSSSSSTMSCDSNRRLQQLLVDVFGIVVPDVPALYRSENLRSRLASLCFVILFHFLEVKGVFFNGLLDFVGHTFVEENKSHA
jgi:hypothetical protein